MVTLTVLSGGPLANPIGQMTEVDRRRPTRMLRKYVEWKMGSSIMRGCPDPDSAWNLVLNCRYEICKNRVDGSEVNPACVNARPSIVRRQSEM